MVSEREDSTTLIMKTARQANVGCKINPLWRQADSLNQAKPRQDARQSDAHADGPAHPWEHGRSQRASPTAESAGQGNLEKVSARSKPRGVKPLARKIRAAIAGKAGKGHDADID